MTLQDRINDYATRHQDELLRLLTTCTELPSPTGKEGPKARWILKELRTIGMDTTYIDDASNVIVPYHIQEDVLAPAYGAHIDTVFSQPVIHSHIEGNIFSAPSCGDNSANVASLLFFIKMVKALDITMPHGCWFVFDVGEEGLGNLRGVRQFLTEKGNHVASYTSLDCNSDCFINLAIGSHRYEVTIHGKSGHSWSDFGNANAIAIAASVIDELYTIVPSTHPRTTYNIGTIQGGTTVNTIAGAVTFTIDMRSESLQALQDLDDTFHQILFRHVNEEGITFEERLIGDRPCSRDSANEALCQRLTAVRRARGLTTHFQSASTDANIPMSLGIPAISFGTCIGRRPHSLEENLDIDSLVPGFIQFAEFALWEQITSK